jgi:hypothetical protein
VPGTGRYPFLLANQQVLRSLSASEHRHKRRSSRFSTFPNNPHTPFVAIGTTRTPHSLLDIPFFPKITSFPARNFVSQQRSLWTFRLVLPRNGSLPNTFLAPCTFFTPFGTRFSKDAGSPEGQLLDSSCAEPICGPSTSG